MLQIYVLVIYIVMLRVIDAFVPFRLSGQIQIRTFSRLMSNPYTIEYDPTSSEQSVLNRTVLKHLENEDLWLCNTIPKRHNVDAIEGIHKRWREGPSSRGVIFDVGCGKGERYVRFCFWFVGGSQRMASSC